MVDALFVPDAIGFEQKQLIAASDFECNLLVEQTSDTPLVRVGIIEQLLESCQFEILNLDGVSGDCTKHTDFLIDDLFGARVEFGLNYKISHKFPGESLSGNSFTL